MDGSRGFFHALLERRADGDLCCGISQSQYRRLAAGVIGARGPLFRPLCDDASGRECTVYEMRYTHNKHDRRNFCGHIADALDFFGIANSRLPFEVVEINFFAP